jgi:hypothetical protein
LPGSISAQQLDERREAWRRRRVVGWLVDRQDWRKNAVDAGYDEDFAVQTIERFQGVRDLILTGASAPDIVRDSGLAPEAALDYLAIVQEESIIPPRVR